MIVCFIFLDDDFLLPFLDNADDGDYANSKKRVKQGDDYVKLEYLDDNGIFDHDDANQNKGGKKRKKDFVQNLVDKCKKLEDENILMRVTVNNLNLSTQMLEARREERYQKIKAIAAAFNEGDVTRVGEVIKANCSQSAVLITPSIFQELNGYFAILKFFTVLLEAFPDALLQIVETKSEDCGVVSSKFNFSGTKVFGLPTDVLLRHWRTAQSNSTATGTAPAVTTGSASTLDRSQHKHADEKTLKMYDELIAHNEALKSSASNSRSDAAKSNPSVKLSGHLFVVFDVEEMISRIVFVWNTTSLIGQVFGQTDDNLASMSQFFSEALSQFRGNNVYVTATKKQ